MVGASQIIICLALKHLCRHTLFFLNSYSVPLQGAGVDDCPHWSIYVGIWNRLFFQIANSAHRPIAVLCDPKATLPLPAMLEGYENLRSRVPLQNLLPGESLPWNFEAIYHWMPRLIWDSRDKLQVWVPPEFVYPVTACRESNSQGCIDRKSVV